MPVYLYAAYCKGYTKIGISEAPKRRIGSMQSGNPFLIELLGAFPLSKEHAIAAEREALLLMSGVHLVGDWFKCTRNHAMYVITQVARQYPAAVVSQRIGNLVKTKAGLTFVRFPRQARAVVTPLGRFASSAEAAREHGLSRQAIWQKVRAGVPGWSFVDWPTVNRKF